MRLRLPQPIPSTTSTRQPRGYRSYGPRIARKTERDSGYNVLPEQVLVTNGGKHALYNTFLSIVDPGDEVLVPAPYWVSYPEMVRLAEGVAVEIPTTEETGFRVTLDQLEQAVTARTKALLFVSPSNPTGAVYPPEEVAAIGRWALEKGIWVVTDEIYEHLVYGDATVLVDAGTGARAGRAMHRHQRGRQDLRDDRVAGRLDDRSEGRDRGRDQHAVTRDVERLERGSGRCPRGGFGRPRPRAR